MGTKTYVYSCRKRWKFAEDLQRQVLGLKETLLCMSIFVYLFTLFNKPGVMIPVSLSDGPVDSGPAGRNRLTGVLLHGVLNCESELPQCMLVSRMIGDNLYWNKNR